MRWIPLLLLVGCATPKPVFVQALDYRASLDEAGHPNMVQRSARGVRDGKKVRANFGQCQDTKALLEELLKAEQECNFSEVK